MKCKFGALHTKCNGRRHHHGAVQQCNARATRSGGAAVDACGRAGTDPHAAELLEVVCALSPSTAVTVHVQGIIV